MERLDDLATVSHFVPIYIQIEIDTDNNGIDNGKFGRFDGQLDLWLIIPYAAASRTSVTVRPRHLGTLACN